jgi:hypothetical protein
MSLTPEDIAAIRQMIDATVAARPTGPDRPLPRSSMEAGSPEFAEDRTQINSLNNKRIHEEYQDLALTAARRSQVNFDNLQQVSLRALNNSVDLQSQINERILKGSDQTMVDLASVNAQKIRLEADSAYCSHYDLSNPSTIGVSDAVGAGAYTPNRTVDTANAGVAAGVSESVQTNVTAQVAEMVTQVATLVSMVNNLSGSVTANLQALTDSNVQIAAALTKLSAK